MGYWKIEYTIDQASQYDILNHLLECDNEFIPPLHQKVNIAEYVEKIFSNATRFEAWFNNELKGLVAAYFNNTMEQKAFITNVSVSPNNYGKGIAKVLLNNCITYGEEKKVLELNLEVNELNNKAINLYKQFGFEIISKHNDLIQMKRQLQGS